MAWQRGPAAAEVRRLTDSDALLSRTRQELEDAYAVVEALKDEGRDAKPPTVYRALEFLMAQGLIHRIERLNAYIGCSHPGADHFGQFLLCRDCGALAELDDTSISSVVGRRAGLRGFAVERLIVEVEGLCPACLARKGLPPVEVR